MKSLYLFFIPVFFFASMAGAATCDGQLPVGFDIQEIRLSLTLQNYDYYVHIEFPDLKKACWNSTAPGNLYGNLPGQKITIRASSLDGTQSNILDHIPTENLRIELQNDSRFLGLMTEASDKDKTQFSVFYSEALHQYITIQQNLRLMPGSKLVRTEVILN